MDFPRALEAVTHDLQLGYTLTKVQVQCIEKLVSGQNVFAFLPTGYGKSDIMVLPSLITSKVKYKIIYKAYAIYCIA